METEWFLIKHTACGSILTINSKIFLESCEKIGESPQCPSCFSPDIDRDSLRLILENYDPEKELDDSVPGYTDLKNAGYTIRKIEKEIS